MTRVRRNWIRRLPLDRRRCRIRHRRLMISTAERDDFSWFGQQRRCSERRLADARLAGFSSPKRSKVGGKFRLRRTLTQTGGVSGGVGQNV